MRRSEATYCVLCAEEMPLDEASFLAACSSVDESAFFFPCHATCLRDAAHPNYGGVDHLFQRSEVKLQSDGAYAVIRIDDHGDSAPNDPSAHVTVKAVVWSEEEAAAEVERLNAANADKGCRYFWQYTRLAPRGGENDP